MVRFSEADFGVVLMLAIVVVPLQLFRLWRLRGERLKTDRYALFAVRDHWIRLVAEGHLTESDKVFQFVYTDLVGIIPKAKPLTLPNIVAALRDSRVINDPEFAKNWRQLLEHNNQHVRKAAEEYVGALMTILIGRSWFVLASVHITHSGVRAFSGLRRMLGRILKTETEAYRLHQKLRRLCPI